MIQDLNYLKSVRQYLHQYPEISGEEKQTANYLLSKIQKLNPTQIITGLGGNGFIVVFDSGVSGDSLLFRAELDGLPIPDKKDSPHQSKNLGFGHQCGHDGHMTILLGVAMWLSDNFPQKGKVSLLFQPAEETGEGASAVIEDQKFKHFHFDAVFALHNLPGFPKSSVVIKDGVFTASVESLVINLEGKTAHAAEPEKGVNPALAVAKIIQYIDQLNINQPQNTDFRLATLVHCKIGELAYGVSAGTAEIHLTLRSWADENLKQLKVEILSVINDIAGEHQLKADHYTLQSFKANRNDLESVEIVRKVAIEREVKLIEATTPFKWGEDFGLFTDKFNGCLFGLGAGEHHPALHHPDYDFPDEIIATGIDIFKGIIQQKTEA